MFGRENKRACVRDEVGESCFVLVAEAAVCAPLLNAGWGISKLSFGVHPLNPRPLGSATSGQNIPHLFGPGNPVLVPGSHGASGQNS